MAKRRKLSPRNRPTQTRSIATVEALVQATARVLLKEGFEACTTNRVAEAAGASIGSLYQYFPNKEALVVAVMERHLATMQESLVKRLRELGDADLPTAAQEMVRAMLAAHRLQPRLHRVLLEQVPRLGALKRLHELHSQYEPLITPWFEEHRAQLKVENPSIAAYVLISAVEGVVTRVLLERPSWLEGGMLERQLTRLVVSYLSPST